MEAIHREVDPADSRHTIGGGCLTRDPA